MSKVLIIEDDTQTSSEIASLLVSRGYEVVIETDGEKGLERAINEKFDAITLDRMLPNISGIEILQSLRQANNDVPVLLISALGLVDDRVQGLKAGGDDYIVKPFANEELLARVEALIRRRNQSQHHSVQLNFLKYEDLELDLLQRTAKRGGVSIQLMAKEFRLLEYFVRYSEQVLTKKMILESLWNLNFDPSTNFVEVHIARLRKKVDAPSFIPLIHTVRGVGYVFGIKP